MGGGSSTHLSTNNNNDSVGSQRSTTTDSPKLPGSSKSPRRLASALSATSRLKFSFKRKTSAREQIRPFEELIRQWPIEDFDLLLEEFEADFKLLELQKCSDSTRKPSKNLVEDLKNAGENGLMADLNLVFKTTSIPFNRLFLTQRCQNLKIAESQNFMNLSEDVRFQKFQPEDVETFLKTYIYTEKWAEPNDTVVLEELRQEFGVQKRLEEDLKAMQKADLKNGDLVIEVVEGKSPNSSENFSIRCSSLIAASRSPIIRSLLLRKRDETENSTPRKIVFSDMIFPRAFAPLFVSFLYTDRLDWGLAPKSEDSISSLSQAKAITTSGKSPDVQLARALQIIEIARFFEVQQMVQACEDVVVKNLSPDNVVHILQWGRANNSPYISSHAFRFIEREFSRISSTNTLFELSALEMTELTRSQFLQSTELELLNACCRWGEHALLRKLEEREPNLVADTCHSISRRGLKKSEKSGEELKEILKPLAENIRKDYALPPFHQDLTDAYNKGILEQSPLGQDLVVCASTSEINPDVHWLKPEQDSAGPRYYRPYHTCLLKHRQLKDPSWTPRILESNSEDVHAIEVPLDFQNLYPDILEDDVYSDAKNSIIRRAKEANLGGFRRNFHRKMALEMIVRQTLTELNISPECIFCELSPEKSKEKSENSTPPDVLPPPTPPGCYDIF